MDTNKGKRINKNYIKSIIFVVLVNLQIFNVYAENDPLKAIDNLSDMIFRIIRMVGYITTGFSMVQFSTSLKGHDSSSRLTSLLGILGGLLLIFSKPIIDAIVGG